MPLEQMLAQIARVMPTALTGSVVRTEGAAAAVAGLPAPVGSLVEIQRQGRRPVPGEVIGFRQELTLVCPLGDMQGVRYGNQVRLARTSRSLRVGPELLGRVINGQGQAIDGGPAPRLDDRVLLQQPAPAALQRPPIDTELSTGIRAIDGLLPCGRGQRLGIFAGAGIGKSVLLGMLARNSAADVNVIALIGERGREVKDFLDKNLGPQGLRKSVVVVATSDEPALVRLQAALAATAVAEYFRDQGREVLLAMDSLTRFALAQREIGLALGEPPAARGYPPSVLASLPRLIERAGRSPRGTITAFYTVLVEGDDLQEPISDAARSLLDGHLVLSRKLAESGHYPAIDVLQSVSRLARELASPEQAAAMARVRQRLAVYREHEDVISIGAYRPGSNPAIDDALRAREPIQRFLRQQIDEPSDTAATRAALQELVNCVAAA